MRILALNGGSSTYKAAVFEGDDLHPIWERRGGLDLAKVLEGAPRPDAVGHRVVHGGQSFQASARVTPEVLQEIVRLGRFAPEHNPRQAQGIEAAQQLFGPDVPHVAVFDTVFHTTLPEEAFVLPGPYSWLSQRIRRYGFHGISHEYVSTRAAEVLGRPLELARMITCHLGYGCSLAAIRDGKSVDTTMSYTPLDGIMMGTRSGSVDPGVLIELMRRNGCSADDLDQILNRESGLKGISGLSGDMREIEEAMRQGNARAKLAFDVFVHRLCAGIGAMAASAGGVDALVFTGGIGENSKAVRSAVVARMGWLGLGIDEAANGADGDRVIGRGVLVVRTREEQQIARETRQALGGSAY